MTSPRGARGSNQYRTRPGTQSPGRSTSTATAAAVTDPYQLFLRAKGSTRTRLKKAVVWLQQQGFAAKTYRYASNECSCCYGFLEDEDLEGKRGGVVIDLNYGNNQTDGNQSKFDTSGELHEPVTYLGWSGDSDGLCDGLEHVGLAVMRPREDHEAIVVVSAAYISDATGHGLTFDQAKQAAAAGWEDPSDAHPWLDADWDLRDAKSWRWTTPDVASAWRSVGVDHWEAAQFDDYGFGPDDVRTSGVDSVRAAVAFQAEHE